MGLAYLSVGLDAVIIKNTAPKYAEIELMESLAIPIQILVCSVEKQTHKLESVELADQLITAQSNAADQQIGRAKKKGYWLKRQIGLSTAYHVECNLLLAKKPKDFALMIVGRQAIA